MLRRMSLDAATVARASRALRGYSMSERSQDRENAFDALTDLIITAQLQGDASVEQRLHEAWEFLAIGPAGANEADNIVGSLSR
jgi:hypothetical protein